MNEVSLRIVKNNFDKKCYDSAGGYVTNCHIEMRPGESIHSYNKNGIKIVCLYDYAIIPREKYFELLINNKSIDLIVNKKRGILRRIFGLR